MTNKVHFIFYTSFLLSLILFAGVVSVPMDIQLLVCGILIFSFGIPHGAIDHVLFFEEQKNVSVFSFYAFYLGLFGLNVALWVVAPMYSFAFFIVMSAYHFGQSQFSHLLVRASKSVSTTLYLCWGLSILIALMYYHAEDMRMLNAQSNDTMTLSPLLDESVLLILMLATTATAIAIMSYYLYTKKLAPEKFRTEIFALGLVHLSFYTLPPLIGFTLYFVILHSIKVLTEEFEYLQTKRKQFLTFSFIRLLVPYTLLSGVMIGLFLWLSHIGILEFSKIFVMLVLVSAITLPHSFVMEFFYVKKYTSRLKIG